jgi:hypothetical protein
MPEIRVKVSEKLNSIVKSIADDLGVPATEYVKSVLLNDLKDKEVKHEQV